MTATTSIILVAVSVCLAYLIVRVTPSTPSRKHAGPEFLRDDIPVDTDPPTLADRKQRARQLAAETSTQNNTANDFELNTHDTEFQWVDGTGVSFDDVGGMDDLKQELKKEIILPLKESPDRAAELGVSASNILFYGQPGTGKTHLARALATELSLPFAEVSGADLQSKWINESADKVNILFEEAREIASETGGAVVFLDELDSVLSERNRTTNKHEEDVKVVNEFLSHLQNTDEYNIVFVGATNRVSALDDAGIRSGRIDRKIEIGKPDAEARRDILKTHLEKRPHNVTEADIKQIAMMTDEAVASDLELIVTEAAKAVLVSGDEEITTQHLVTAVQKWK